MVLTINVFVQSFEYNNHITNLVVNFLIYDEQRSMTLYEFYRKIRVPVEGSHEPLPPRGILPLYLTQRNERPVEG